MHIVLKQSNIFIVLIFVLNVSKPRVQAAILAAEQDAIQQTCTSESGASASSTTEIIPIVSRKSVAEQGQFPEVAAVVVMDQFMCSASIIADDAVITAAICLGILPDLKPEEVTLIAGDVNRTKGESIKAKRIIIHPLFRYYPQQALLEHDIAIIQLAQPFNFNDGRTAKIKLPSVSDANSDLTNLEGVVAGWGAVALRNKMLQYVNVTVYNQSECKEYYKKLSPAPYSLEHYQICSEATEDLCIGESGAGLRIFFNGEDQPTLVGIAEPLADCPHPKRPEIYTRVSEYLEWINKSLN